MPIHFEFMDRESNDAVPYKEINDLICESLGEKSRKVFSDAFQEIREIGISILDDNSIDEMASNLLENYRITHPNTGVEWSIIKRFLFEDYLFIATFVGG